MNFQPGSICRPKILKKATNRIYLRIMFRVLKQLTSKWTIPGWLVLLFDLLVHVLDWADRLESLKSKISQMTPALRPLVQFIVSGKGQLLILVIGLLFLFVATWRKIEKADDEKKKNDVFKKPSPQLGDTNPILFSCGRSVDQSIILANGITWFRARMELNGAEPIQNISAHVTAMRKDGEKLQLNEVVNLTLHPGYPTLTALKEGVPGLIDVVKVEADGRAALALAYRYPAVDAHSFFTPGHSYEIDISVTADSMRTQKPTLIFTWTGDRDTAELSVKRLSRPSSDAVPPKELEPQSSESGWHRMMERTRKDVEQYEEIADWNRRREVERDIRIDLEPDRWASPALATVINQNRDYPAHIKSAILFGILPNGTKQAICQSWKHKFEDCIILPHSLPADRGMRLAFAGNLPYESFKELFVELEFENGRKITGATISSPRPPRADGARLNKILLECADAMAGGKKMFWALLDAKADEFPYSDHDKLVEIVEMLTSRGHENQLDAVPQKAWLSVLKEARLRPNRPRDEVELYDFICELANLRPHQSKPPL